MPGTQSISSIEARSDCGAQLQAHSTVLQDLQSLRLLHEPGSSTVVHMHVDAHAQ